jgi:hypothetical protein
MTLPAISFDVAGAAIGGGYRVMYIRSGMPTRQAIFDTPRDCAAAAMLCDAAVLTRDADVRAACRAAGAAGRHAAGATMTPEEHDTIKALLIAMRRYFISHNCPTGECVAWQQLKAMFDVGQRDEDDEAWMTGHTGQPFTLRRSADERRWRRGE